MAIPPASSESRGDEAPDGSAGLGSAVESVDRHPSERPSPQLDPDAIAQVHVVPDEVEGRLLYNTACSQWDNQDEPIPAAMLLATVNDKRHGLGMALPMGGITVFEAPNDSGAFGDQLVAEERIRDYAEGQDVELALGTSSQVFAQCERPGLVDPGENPARWTAVKVTLTNANRTPARVRVVLGASGQWQLRGLQGTRVKDGEVIVEVTVPGNGRREVSWNVRPAGAI